MVAGDGEGRQWRTAVGTDDGNYEHADDPRCNEGEGKRVEESRTAHHEATGVVGEVGGGLMAAGIDDEDRVGVVAVFR